VQPLAHSPLACYDLWSADRHHYGRDPRRSVRAQSPVLCDEVPQLRPDRVDPPANTQIRLRQVRQCHRAITEPLSKDLVRCRLLGGIRPVYFQVDVISAVEAALPLATDDDSADRTERAVRIALKNST
jgi:hypothetical protein